ncbi:MAG: hypothetical protein K2Q18_07830, partial [Bdellovibrionales bacterium]|nr:hypothetical protein [Bdellovibrionales bacterium]
MSKYYPTLLILLCFTTIQAAELVKVNGKESKDFQESAFVKIMARLNGGAIPYPFEKFLDSFGTGEKEKGDILLVPKGRSLVKESADYHNPRIIVAPFSNFPNFNSEKTEEEIKWQAKKKLIREELGIESGDLFIGFAPNHKALEIISYNPNKPGYDFFIVENYEEGKTPKIISNPSLCLSCHQNKGPIFPRVGWNEILGETANLPISDKTLKENEMMDRVKAANPERKKIEGILLDDPERFNTTKVAVFDSNVRSGNSQLASNEFCNALCDKKDFKCQKALIEETLNKTFKYSSYPNFSDRLKKLNAIKISSSVLPNRDPYTNKAFKVFVSQKSIEKTNKENNSTNTIDNVAQSLGVDTTFLLNQMKNNKNGYEVTNHVVIQAEEQILVDDPDAINPATTRTTEASLDSLINRIKNEKDFNNKIKIAAEMCIFMPVPPEE